MYDAFFKFKSLNTHFRIRINSPHYLVKLVDNETGPIYYTLVLSQYEKSSTIYYSLRVYSTNQFELKELKDVYNQNYSKKVTIENRKKIKIEYLFVISFLFLDNWKLER